VYVRSPVERGFWLGAAWRGLAVDAAGNIFGASWSGNLYEFDSVGNIVSGVNPETFHTK